MNKTTLLAELEAQIDNAQCQMYEALKQIKDEKLWTGYYDGTFWGYLLKRHGYSRPWFSQLQANYNAMTEIEETMPMKNEYAKRTLRESDKQVRQACYDRAVALAKSNGDDVVTSAHIKAVGETVTTVLKTSYADTGDGTMTAADAQIEQEHQEQLLRRKAHINNGREWFTVSYVGGMPFVFEGIPAGKTVEIKWYIVEASDE